MKKIFLPLLALLLGAAAEAGEPAKDRPGLEAYYKMYDRAVEAHLHSRLGEACALYSGAVKEAGGSGAEREYGRAITMLAVAYHARGDFKQAEKHYRRSVNYCRKYKLPELSVAVGGLGRLYLERKRLKKAGPLLKESADLQYKEMGEVGDLYGVADSLSSLAQLYEQLGNEQKAEMYYLTAAKLFKDAPTSFPFKVLDAELRDSYPIILYRTGLFFRKSGKGDDGRGYYARALRAFENWTALEDRPALKARVLDYRGRTLRSLGRGPEAEADRREAARLYKQIGEGAAD